MRGDREHHRWPPDSGESGGGTNLGYRQSRTWDLDNHAVGKHLGLSDFTLVPSHLARRQRDGQDIVSRV
jgi:hypothetical protein